MNIQIIKSYLGKKFRYIDDIHRVTGKLVESEGEADRFFLTISRKSESRVLARVEAYRLPENDFRVVNANVNLSDIPEALEVMKICIVSLQSYTGEIPETENFEDIENENQEKEINNSNN